VTLVLALLAGALTGLSLGALGGGGSILAVPVLVYALGQSPAQATTGSLVVVGVTSLIGAVTAYRSGHVMLARGAAFGAVALGGAAVGAKASAHVSEPVLLACFAALMLLVAAIMVLRLLRENDGAPGRAALDDPIITFSPTFACQCPRALMVLLTATVVGLLTGFLGVGGGFLVVPALPLALALPMEIRWPASRRDCHSEAAKGAGSGSRWTTPSSCSPRPRSTSSTRATRRTPWSDRWPTQDA
jgi:uncharacterized membrane protein YfcA